MYDAIPQIFKKCDVVSVKWDTKNIQNISQLFMLNSTKNKIWYLYTLILNVFFILLDKCWISKIKPQDYFKNSMTWNIMIILKKR